MSGPSLRHGLPYGWWRSRGFWWTLLDSLVVVSACTLLAFVLLAWWEHR